MGPGRQRERGEGRGQGWAGRWATDVATLAGPAHAGRKERGREGDRLRLRAMCEREGEIEPKWLFYFPFSFLFSRLYMHMFQ